MAGDESEDIREILRPLRRRFQPNTVVLLRDSTTAYRSTHLDAMFRGRESSGQVTAYICQGSSCEPPVAGKSQILERLLATP